MGNAYLPTTSGTRLEYQGVMAAAGSLEVLVNDVSAADELTITG
jgi:non-ribosomal peptide synthetase component F